VLHVQGVSHLKQIADSWADAHEIALLAEDAFLGKNYSESAIRSAPTSAPGLG
jgi:hypothetical protein